MRKIRYCLTLIMLMASLSGFTFLGLGSGSLAATAHTVGTSSRSVAFIRLGACPGTASDDC